MLMDENCSCNQNSIDAFFSPDELQLSGLN